MSKEPFQTNDSSWRNGYSGQNSSESSDTYRHEQGRLQREREHKEQYDREWNNK